VGSSCCCRPVRLHDDAPDRRLPYLLKASRDVHLTGAITVPIIAKPMSVRVA